MKKINDVIIKNVRVCPVCGGEQVKVYNSREISGVLKRFRECIKCGHRFCTYEIAEDDAEKLGTNEALYKQLLEVEKKRAEILEGVKDAEIL